MRVKENFKKFAELTPTILLSGTLFFLAMHYNGHITLMQDNHRLEKMNSLEEIIVKEGCIKKKEARKQLQITRQEMVELVRNASNYQASIKTSQFDNITHPLIVTCYMAQTSRKNELQSIRQTEAPAEPS